MEQIFCVAQENITNSQTRTKSAGYSSIYIHICKGVCNCSCLKKLRVKPSSKAKDLLLQSDKPTAWTSFGWNCSSITHPQLSFLSELKCLRWLSRKTELHTHFYSADAFRVSVKTNKLLCLHIVIYWYIQEMVTAKTNELSTRWYRRNRCINTFSATRRNERIWRTFYFAVRKCIWTFAFMSTN